MISNILTRIFGSRNERLLKQYAQVVRQVNALESSVSGLSDADLAARTITFRERVANGEALEALMPEAFAVVREAGKRALQMRHFDVNFERLRYVLALHHKLKHTIIVITADHGEELLDHGFIGHASTAVHSRHYDELIHIPLKIGRAHV